MGVVLHAGMEIVVGPQARRLARAFNEREEEGRVDYWSHPASHKYERTWQVMQEWRWLRRPLPRRYNHILSDESLNDGPALGV